MAIEDQPDPKAGDVIQIDPDYKPCFASCLAIVTEAEPWGVKASILAPRAGLGERHLPAVIPILLGYEDFVRIGPATWIPLDVGDPEGKDQVAP